MTEKIELRVDNPPKHKAENGPISATPENLPFFEGEFCQLFSYFYGSKVPKKKSAHIILCKKFKKCLIKLIYSPRLNPKKKKHPVHTL